MEGIKLDRSKLTTFKREKGKKALLLEITKKPEELKSKHLKEEKGYLHVDEEYFAFDYYYPKGDLKSGGGIILFALIIHFGVGGGGILRLLFLLHL